jgi:hypothetical protein
LDWRTVPIHGEPNQQSSTDEWPADAAGVRCSSDGSDPVGDDSRQIDKIIADMEALFEEARQLRTRCRTQQQDPHTSS